MMTAKINNGTTETKTRLVRWKRRVLGFEGAAVTLYLPSQPWPIADNLHQRQGGRTEYLCGRSRFARASLSNARQSATLPFNYNSCWLLPLILFYYG